MINKKIFTAVLLVLVVSFSAYADNSGWILIKDKDGITVKKREVKGSQYKEYLTEAVIDAPLEVVFEVESDSSSFSNWFSDCERQDAIKYIDENNKIVYQLIHVVWPFDNRDFVANVNYNNDLKSGVTVLTVKSMDRQESIKWVPEQKGTVRISRLDSVFTGRRLSPGRTQLEVYGFADPVIFLPSWAIEAVAANGPYNTIVNLRKEVKKTVYWDRAAKKHNRNFNQEK